MIVAAIQKPGYTGNDCVPIFDAITRTHTADADEYCVVTQPDHAKVSGAVASAFDRQRFPFLDEQLVEAIGLHDYGWVIFDGIAPNPLLPPVLPDGRLRSFLTTPPEMFLRAWFGSIEHASQICAAAGVMVSQHFEQLAEFRLESAQDGPDDTYRLQQFRENERRRQSALNSTLGPQEQSELLRVLQFCDLASLYVSCGIHESVVLPPLFKGRPLQMRRNGDAVEVLNSPLTAKVKTNCPAFQWKRGSRELKPNSISIEMIPV